MSEIHVPYTDFDPDKLGHELHLVASDTATRHMLQMRHMLGVIARYGQDEETAVRSVKKGQQDHHAGRGHYARINTVGDVIGASSVDPWFGLVKQQLPLPGWLSRRVPKTTVTYPYATPNIQAYVLASETDELPNSYEDIHTISKDPIYRHIELGDETFPPLKDWLSGRAWTAEPLRSPRIIHESILAVEGLQYVATKRFDDVESPWIPPKSTLYAEKGDHWIHSRGTLAELQADGPIVAADDERSEDSAPRLS